MPAAALDVRAVESLLAFWSEAGVDACYEDESVDRLAESLRPARAPVSAPTLIEQAPPAASATPDIAAAIAEARRLAAAAQDLTELAAAVAAFDGCPLKREGARQAVFSRGAADAPVMIIGEAPGAEEDIQGAPFVGRAGKLLDRMVAAAGLKDRVFITNTVYWRPPGNRTPSPQEQMICAPFLERAIALVSPRFLLLVGGASTKSVLQRPEGILTLRGRWFDWRAEGSDQVTPALPTLHPAFLLRQPAAKKKAWADLLTLTERLDRPDRPA
ncbi:MAG TPA: uracil-DNA glycosylase [Caulobacteraceae bacterium]